MLTMNSVNILCWVFTYIGYLFIQSFIINGIHASAEGETKILPDGSEKDAGMILYPLKKYLLQYKLKKNYYEGAEFNKIWNFLRHKYINVIPPSVKDNGINKITASGKEDLETMKKLCYVFERDHEIMWMNEDDSFTFYKEYKDYKFSKYVRMPVIQCVKCMSSFWSLALTFLPVVVCLFGFQWWLIPLCVCNIFALAYLNKLIYKP